MIGRRASAGTFAISSARSPISNGVRRWINRSQIPKACADSRFHLVRSIRASTIAALAGGVLAAALPARQFASSYTQNAPDTSFAGLVAQLSEPNGYFDSDNIVTNEV